MVCPSTKLRPSTRIACSSALRTTGSPSRRTSWVNPVPTVSSSSATCEKRPVSAAALEMVGDRVEVTLQDRPEKEISTEEIGAFLMEELKDLDKVAYVRFASVYRHFSDIGEFMTELRGLLDAKE